MTERTRDSRGAMPAEGRVRAVIDAWGFAWPKEE